jgi:hypothetical protein
MPDRSSFDYAVVRVVPQVEREEFINAGVILRCRERRYLAARITLDRARLRALAPNLDLEMAQAELDLIPLVCAGGPAAGPLGELSQAERFRWLTSPRSTTVQVSPVHCGRCDDPQAALDDLFEKMVK